MRLRAQRLDTRAQVGVQQVVSDLCGIQAQDAVAGALAIRVRASGLTAPSVNEARTLHRSVVLTWAMRGTMHLVASEDAMWLLRLLGPPMIRKSRRRHGELGLTEEAGSRAVGAVRETLEAHGPMSRAGIARSLAGRGLPVEGQAIYHILRLAALEGVVCFGPEQGDEGTYDLLDRWAPAPRRVDDPLADLARRYVVAYGPASPGDLAAWSGLPLRDSRSAFQGAAGELLEVSIEGSPAWIHASREGWLDAPGPDAPTVRLLPAFDTYLLGYRERDLGVSDEFARRVHPGGGIIRPTLMVDGRAAGVWSRKRTRRGIAVTATMFDDLPPEIHPFLEEEAVDVGRFLGAEAELSIVRS